MSHNSPFGSTPFSVIPVLDTGIQIKYGYHPNNPSLSFK
ncbi:hypothetical protein wVul_0162 [Wolbachia endosymbiont of Armadillidium vulgare str. wVulC]|nr:hypothetical protein wVul_0162 [Wolbachia endosymbiont of Armadillidium vulgare str. wVulC]